MTTMATARKDTASSAMFARNSTDSGIPEKRPHWANSKHDMKTNQNTQEQSSQPLSFLPMNLDELRAAAEKEQAKMDAIFQHDEECGYITINAMYPYEIQLSRIPDRESLLQWVSHLSGKTWMTRELIREFIRRVGEIKGWNIHHRSL